MVQLAFYKAEGQLFDKLIRFWTRSKYSHVELVFSDGTFFSSSPRDGGVRYKVIDQDAATWDFVEIQIDTFDENKIRRWCDTKVGRGYDWLGILLSQFLPLGIDDSARWFCSEICTAAIQLAGKLTGIKPSAENPHTMAKVYGLE